MKQRKVGDKIVFNYDVYDIVNNVEHEYDHTDTLAGIITRVEDGRYYPIYEVKITKVINAENPSYYPLGMILKTTGDKIFSGGGLHNAIFKDCSRPTPQQAMRIIEMYDSKKSLEANLKEIGENWYKYGLEKVGMYDEEDFNL